MVSPRLASARLTSSRLRSRSASELRYWARLVSRLARCACLIQRQLLAVVLQRVKSAAGSALLDVGLHAVDLGLVGLQGGLEALLLLLFVLLDEDRRQAVGDGCRQGRVGVFHVQHDDLRLAHGIDDDARGDLRQVQVGATWFSTGRVVSRRA